MANDPENERTAASERARQSTHSLKSRSQDRESVKKDI